MSFNNLGKNVARAGGFLFSGPPKLGVPVINKTGSSIAAGKIVALSGFDVTSKMFKVVLADADVAGHVDLYVTFESIANDAQGNVYKGGISASNLDTSGVTTVGDAIYLSTTAGAFTATAPTAVNSRQIVVGYVGTKSSTLGQVYWIIGQPTKMSNDDYQTGANVILRSTSGAYAPTMATLNGSHLILDHATAITTTLPAPLVGARFVVSVKTSGAHTFTTDAGTTFLRGTVLQALEATTPAANDGPKFFTANGTSHTVMTLGTTKGGLKGSRYTFECVESTIWQVSGFGLSSGIIVTPFS